MPFSDAEYGSIDHFMLGLIEIYGPLEAILISEELEKYAQSNRGNKLNKWTLAYLAEELSRQYAGFDLYVTGYFGDGDGELRFGSSSHPRDSDGKFIHE